MGRLYVKQIAYETDILIPKKVQDGGVESVQLKSYTLDSALFSEMVNGFKTFSTLGINVPVTTQHFTNDIAETLGYVKALFQQKDAKGRDGLFAVIDFNAEPDANVLNAGASLEHKEEYLIPTTGNIIANALTAVTITPTPVIPGMSGFSLALSLGVEGEQPDTVTKKKTMGEQLLVLVCEFLGIDPKDYEGKDVEMIEVVARGLKELKNQPAVQQAAEEVVNSEEEAIAQDQALSDNVEIEVEEKDKDKIIEDLQLALGGMRREIRMNKLNALVENGKLNKQAFEKAKAMYGGNLALSRDKEFNDVVQIIESNTPAHTKSITGAQVLQKTATEIVNNPLAAAQARRYGK